MSASWPNASILSTSSWANASVFSGQNGDPSWSNAEVLGGGFTIAEAALEGFSDVGEAIDHLQTLLSLCDGSSTPLCTPARLRAAYEQAFDRNATALAYRMGTPIFNLMNPNKRMEYSFDRLYQNVFVRFTKFQKPVKIVSIEPLLRGMIEFIIQVEYVDHCWVTFRYHAFTRHGRISRMESIETIVTYDDDDDDDKNNENNNAVLVAEQRTKREAQKRDETNTMTSGRGRARNTAKKRQVNFPPKDRRQQSPYLYRPPSSRLTARALLCCSSGAVCFTGEEDSSMCSRDMPKC